MKVIYSWLKEFVQFEWTPEELSNKLTMVGLEVEGIERVGKTFSGVITGKVVTREKHPNADKLSVCQVDLGDGKPVQIVCGAPNVLSGQTVPVAAVGALLPGNFEIKKAKIRNQESNGMICSKSELGFEEGKSDGIWILDENTPLGVDFGDYLQLKEDYVLEIGITANRGDCLSHLGVAREIVALTGGTLTLPDTTLDPKNYLSKNSDEYIKIEINDVEGCPVYSGHFIQGLKNQQSPQWMQNRLNWLGLRPRNVLVDVTNYVLHELGQPLHAFDYDRLKSKKIVVKSFDNLKFTTLDSKERNLPENSLMICDGETPVAIAGVMGGENSEIVDNTSNVLLESAFFNPSRVRKTAKKTGLSTDASYRFERGTDPKITEFASKRAVKLLVELAGGLAAKLPLEIAMTQISKRELVLRFAQIKRIIGIEIPKSNVLTILKSLGFEIVGEGNDQLSVRVPTHRHDIEREIDIIEELIRIYGLEHVKEADFNIVSLKPETPSNFKQENNLRLVLNGAGFSEVICNSMIPKQNALLYSETVVDIQNPQSEDMSTLRPSLIPGMLEIVKRNLNRGTKDIKIFELGNCFEKKGSTQYPKIESYAEQQYFAFILTGNLSHPSWNQPARESSIFDLKGLAEEFLSRIFRSEKISYKPLSHSSLSDSLEVFVGKKSVGKIGRVSDSVMTHFDIKQPVFSAEFNLEILRTADAEPIKYAELPKFLPIERDLTFEVEKSVPVGSMIEAIKSTNPKLIKKVEIFDLYQNKENKSNLVSVGFRLTLLNEEKTFEDKEIRDIFISVIEKLKVTFDANLKGVVL